MEDLSGRRTWTPPPRPASIPCPGCGEPLDPEPPSPVFWEGRPVGESGDWFFPNCCKECVGKKKGENETDAKRFETERDKEAERLLGLAGLYPLHQNIEIGKCYIPSNVANIDANKNLYIFGLPGRGKSYYAVARLKQYVRAEVKPGLYVCVPDFMNKCRRAVKSRDDSELIEKLINTDFLVLDELGKGRTTDYAIEQLYIVINRWMNLMKTGLIITSNLTLDGVSMKLDGGIASRIAGMCEVIEFGGVDRRLPGWEPLQK